MSKFLKQIPGYVGQFFLAAGFVLFVLLHSLFTRLARIERLIRTRTLNWKNVKQALRDKDDLNVT